MERIHSYIEKYTSYVPDEWYWRLNEDDVELFNKYRRRYDGDDIMPDFSSIEKDAVKLGFNRCEFKDIVGIRWIGRKGTYRLIGSPDAIGSLYCNNFDEDYYDCKFGVSEKYAMSNKNLESDALNDGYIMYSSVRNGTVLIDVKNIKEIEYKYVVNNHLFKDTNIQIKYEDGCTECIFDYSGYGKLINWLRENNIQMLKDLLAKINEHFEKLKNSESDDIRSFWPGMTAEEYFK